MSEIKKRKKFSDLQVGDSVYCLNRCTHELSIEKIIKIDNWNGRYFLSGPTYYSHPEFNYMDGEQTSICNHEDFVFSNKEAIIDYIRDTVKRLKSTKTYLQKLKL